MWPISSRLAHGTTVLLRQAPPSGSSVCLRAHNSSCARELTIARPFRLCPLEGHADAGHRPRVQDLPHVRDDQHRRHGRLQPVRRPAAPLCVVCADHVRCRLIPETKGRSLEEMDIIFGAVQADKRRADIENEERQFAQAHPHDENSVRSEMEKV